MSVIPFTANLNGAPRSMFDRQTTELARQLLMEVSDSRIGRCALLEAASMMICAAALDDDEPVAMATALIDELSERTYDMIALCREVPDGAA